MSIDMFATRVLMAAVEQMKRPKTFFLDTFFRTSKVSNSKYVDIDIIKGKRKLAPFVSPRMQGELMEKNGYQTNTYAPPYVKPKIVLEPEDFDVRDAGTTNYGVTETAGSRAQKKLGEKLVELDETITRREEWMAASGLLTGKVPVVGKGVNIEIDFLMESTHIITLAGADLWSAATSDPIGDLEDWALLIAKDSGLACNVVVMGLDAARAFTKHADVQKVLDNRRMAMGEIKPEAIANGAQYLGYVNSVGADIYMYHEWYVDEATGTEASLMDTKKVLLGSTRATCVRHYGAIKDLKCMNAVERFAKSWEEEDPSARYLMMQSAPLPAPHQIDAFVVAKVLA